MRLCKKIVRTMMGVVSAKLCFPRFFFSAVDFHFRVTSWIGYVVLRVIRGL